MKFNIEHARFDWVSATRNPCPAINRKSAPYAALNAQARGDLSYFQMRRAGRTREMSITFLDEIRKIDRQTAMNLWDLAVRQGFIDC